MQVFLDLRVIITGSREESGSNSRADQAGGGPSETRDDTSNALGQGGRHLCHILTAGVRFLAVPLGLKD